MQHGLPDMERDWSLDADERIGKSERGKPVQSVRTCKKCFAIYLPTLAECPQCAHRNPKQVRDIRELEGEAIPLERVAPMLGAAEATMRARYRGLVEEAREKNFKPGWALHRFKWMFGRWPRREWAQ
jgi:hypothetical protein